MINHVEDKRQLYNEIKSCIEKRNMCYNVLYIIIYNVLYIIKNHWMFNYILKYCSLFDVGEFQDGHFGFDDLGVLYKCCK